MAIWIPLLSACVGGLLATIPLLLGIVVQVYIHRSENSQKKKEAKTQLALELTRNDIKTIGDYIDNDIKAMEVYDNIRFRKELGKITDDEMEAEMRNTALDENSKANILTETSGIAEKLAYSLGDKVYEEFKNYMDASDAHFLYFQDSPTITIEEVNQINEKLLKSAAKLHNILNNKLISIRDS